MNTILLGIIAIAEVIRLTSLFRKTNKKAHFKNKLKGSEQMIWDLEFKMFKTREIREEIRKEYDFMNSRIDGLNKQLEAEKDKGEKARIKDAIELAERDKDRLEAQIKSLDVEINGAEKSAEYPDGAVGMVQNIDSIRELQSMIKTWIKAI